MISCSLGVVTVMSVEVIKAYKAQYPDPICFEAGAVVKVGRQDSEYPGWFWCRAPSEKEGWVHQSFLAANIGTTTSVHPYSARELTAVGGERGTAIHCLDRWVYIRLDSGDEGWIPQSHVLMREA